MVVDAAGWLAARGLRPGDVAGLWLKDTPLHLALIYGCARAGIVMLPLDWKWTPAEAERVARHFGARIVVTDPGAPLLDVPTVAVETLPRAAAAAFGAEADDLLLLSLSSGTTGRPKGPAVSHRQFFRRFMTHWLHLGFTDADRFLCATPLYFGGGRTFAMSMLFTGATVVLASPAADLAPLVERERITCLFLVPTQLRRLMTLDDAALAPLRDLRLLFSSGAPLTVAERHEIAGRLCPRFHEYYASTEGGGVSLLTPADLARRPDSVGRPVFGVEVEVVDDEDRPLPADAVGRIRYRGPGVATGYHLDPEASVERFRDGWFYPGDLAAIDADGFVCLRGRREDVIIRGGINLYPTEIEAVLTAHPAVLEAAIVPRASATLGEEVAAFVVPRAAVNAEALMAWCAERLAPYKRPAVITLLAELPRNSAGKVLKARLSA
jgi:acyl-CoA synthetase (AMP-forming)/AMP-acid ligase II